MVLDRNYEDSIRLKKLLCVAKKRIHRIAVLRWKIFPRIFEHTNECYYIKQGVRRKLVERINDDINIRQVSASRCRSGGTDWATFQCNNFSSTFTEKACNCPTARSDLEDTSAKKVFKGPKQVAAQGAEVVMGRPVSYVAH